MDCNSFLLFSSFYIGVINNMDVRVFYLLEFGMIYSQTVFHSEEASIMVSDVAHLVV